MSSQPMRQQPAGRRPFGYFAMAEDHPFPTYLVSHVALFAINHTFSLESCVGLEQNNCAYPQMKTDPLLENLRVMLLRVACRQHSLEQKNRTDLKVITF